MATDAVDCVSSAPTGGMEHPRSVSVDEFPHRRSVSVDEFAPGASFGARGSEDPARAAAEQSSSQQQPRPAWVAGMLILDPWHALLVRRVLLLLIVCFGYSILSVWLPPSLHWSFTALEMMMLLAFILLPTGYFSIKWNSTILAFVSYFGNTFLAIFSLLDVVLRLWAMFACRLGKDWLPMFILFWLGIVSVVLRGMASYWAKCVVLELRSGRRITVPSSEVSHASAGVMLPAETDSAGFTPSTGMAAQLSVTSVLARHSVRLNGVGVNDGVELSGKGRDVQLLDGGDVEPGLYAPGELPWSWQGAVNVGSFRSDVDEEDKRTCGQLSQISTVDEIVSIPASR